MAYFSAPALSHTIGTRLGSYEITAAIGAGGMGEVYRARDTKLNRDVAIKVLPEMFALDVERLARFTREAQVLASLNHPNIAAIYGIEGHALVMELVEGEDLSAHLARGAMPLTDVLPIARQIAEALEAAHEAGIVHRDLKPANIKLRTDGAVKVLDFGLAKALDTKASGAASGDAANSPTLITRATQMGMILGTAAYMAPEQARGKTVDKRGDIWAFGVVLYEMLAGQRAFNPSRASGSPQASSRGEGTSVTDVLAAVLRQDIDWTAIPADTPPRLRRLLARCLERDVKQRLRDIGEARVEIAGIASGDIDTAGAIGRAPEPAPPRRRREALAWSVAGIAVLSAVALAYAASRRATVADAPVIRFALVPPDHIAAVDLASDSTVVSPDGRQVVFTGRTGDGPRQLWVRALDSLDARALVDTEDAMEPFWSPDSRSIAFAARGKLKRVDLAGGRAQTLADAARLTGGSWGRAGVIAFTPDYRSAVAQVPAAGGPTTPATRLDAARGDFDHRAPSFLPDGRHFLYRAAIGNDTRATLVVGSIDSLDGKEISAVQTPALYSPPGWLLYVRNGTLVAQAFDAATLTLSDEAHSLSTGGANDRGLSPNSRVSVSENGVLLRRDVMELDYQLVWFDRSGRQTGRLGPAMKVGGGQNPAFSPDGKRAVVQRFDPQSRNQDIWVADLARGTFDRLTTDPVLEQLPVWSPDGKSVVIATSRNGVGGLHQVPVSGGEVKRMLAGTVFPKSFSPDGRFLIYNQRGEKTRLDIWVLPLSGEKATPFPIINSDADETQAQVSPDGRWLAYSSDVTGTSEVYVRRLTSDGRVGEATRVSIGSGLQPRWRADGRELFYISAPQSTTSGQMTAVAVNTSGETFGLAAPTPLFKPRMLPNQISTEYDVTADGKRFLIGTMLGDGNAMATTVVLNWRADLRK